MSQLTEDLRAKHQRCCVNGCAERNCSLSLAGLARDDFVIISPDRVLGNTGGKRCDGLVFYDRGGLRVIPIELKSGRFDAREAAKQLTGGAQIAASESVISAARVQEFIPLLLHKGIKAIEVRVLRGQRVRFRKAQYSITLKRCGFRLAELLRD